jgi:hypothetical protein
VRVSLPRLRVIFILGSSLSAYRFSYTGSTRLAIAKLTSAKNTIS